MNAEPTLEHLLTRVPWLVVDGDRRVDDITERAKRVAGGMRARGVHRGQSVAFQLGNTVESTIAYRACWRIGATAVALHHRFGEREIDTLIERVAPALVLTTPTELAELSHGDAVEDIAAQPDDDAVVLFTAGSTGEPNGVRHTHRALAYKTQLMAEVHGLTSADVVLMPAPLAHISGLLNGVLVPNAVGMTTVLLERWSPSVAIDLIEQEDVSYMVGPPTFFVDVMNDPGFTRRRVASLRIISSGGAGVATSFIDRAREELGAVVKRSYGSTEAPTVATSLGADDPDTARHYDGHSIGAAELRLHEGELLVRGPELFAGYLSDDQTAAVMIDGWFRTGDLATITDDGWLTITGRVKDLVIRAGENISVREVEDTLLAHPAIHEASVFGVPHDRLGEQVAAVVGSTTTFSLDDCRAWFLEQGVARFKVPEVVMTLERLPRLPTGKVDRERLREMVTSPDVS